MTMLNIPINGQMHQILHRKQWCRQNGFDEFGQSRQFPAKGTRTRQFLVLQIHKKNSDLSVLFDFQMTLLLEMIKE